MVGEHIRALKDGRWNHAIDCGDETVIHLSEETTHPSRVRRSYRPEFVAGAAVVEVVTHRERTFPAAEVVARAYSRISDAGLSATFRDSEAFADWCVTGRLAAAVPNLTVAPGVEAVTPAPSLPAAPRKAKASTAGKARRSVPAKGRRREARGKSSRAPAKRQAGARKAAKKKTAKKKAVRRGRAARRR